MTQETEPSSDPQESPNLTPRDSVLVTTHSSSSPETTNNDQNDKDVPNESDLSPNTTADNELKAKKDKIKSELEDEPELYERPEKALDDVIKERHGEEKGVFEGLIKENVVLEREKRKATEKLQEATAQMEVLQVEMENQRLLYNELETRNKSMEVEIKDLTKALQRAKKASGDVEENNNSGLMEDDPDQAKRIRDLQFRLMRMTNDMEEKDKQMEKLEKEKEEMTIITEELEKLVDSSKVTEIKEKVKGENKDDQLEKRAERANVVKQAGGATNSKICVVM